MRLQLLIEIAHEFDLNVPFEMDGYETAQLLIEHLSQVGRNEVIDRFGDAGMPVSHFYVLKEPAPSIDLLRKRANLMFYPEGSLKKGMENQPYYNEVELHKGTNSVRVRFHYIKGVQPYFDDETDTVKEFRRPFSGCLVLRPNSSLLEVRAPHASIAKKVALRTTIMSLVPYVALDLTQGKSLDKLYEWVYSLNNGKIDLPPTDSRSSVSMSARRGRNLLQTKDFLNELKRGRFRGGHVTIENKKDNFIKFFVYVKPCHVHFTHYYSNKEIEYVISALETIAEGYDFVSPETLLKYLK